MLIESELNLRLDSPCLGQKEAKLFLLGNQLNLRTSVLREDHLSPAAQESPAELVLLATYKRSH